MIRLLIADDQKLFRSMLAEILQKTPDIEIVASCADGKEAVEIAEQLKPDIVLMDIGMPGGGGIEALRALKERLPNTKVAMLTTFEDDENVKAALLLGADGYLIKDMVPGILISAIKSIFDDMILLHRGVYKVLQEALRQTGRNHDDKVEIGELIFDMTEISIMKLVCQGKSNKEIAALLNYSEGTIKNKVSKLLSLTGLSDRMELSVFAISNQII